MKIAIVGSGISGLVCAHVLHPRHDVTLFEADDRVGGHTHTVVVESAAGPLAVDTGFIVFNDRTYPAFIGLLDSLGVESQPTEMSFSVRCDRTAREYNGSNLNGLFAQRRNLVRPSFLRMLADILRFNRHGPSAMEATGDDVTVGEFLRAHRYSTVFAEHYLLPMGAAIWSCPVETFSQFPMRFILEFYRNHGLMQLTDRPTWRVICGGSRTYVEKILAPLRHRVRTRCPALRVERHDDQATVFHAGGAESFDEVILACHSDQALKLLADPSPVEREILSEFPYGENVAVLHTDESVLPRRRRAWASWNYHLRHDRAARPSVTYNMNILQRLSTPETWCVTLNEEDAIDPARVFGRYRYSHPIFTVRRRAAQRRHAELIRHRRTSYCGAYWGNGFHEDGVRSALAVCEAFGARPGWAPAASVSRPATERAREGALSHAG